MKNYKIAISYYLIIGLIILGAIKIYPSGSCGPSLGVLVFLAFNLLSIILFLASLIMFLNNKEYTKSTVIHLVGCIALLSYFFNASQL